MTLDELAPSLESLYATTSILSEKLHFVRANVANLLASKAKYLAVEAETSIPWFVIACIHELESSGSFEKHLHNGDPLTDRTVHVPKGRPKAKPKSGKLPYDWCESAIDALSIKKLPSSWGLGQCLAYIESYNGFGYEQHEVNSPYVWSFTTAYSSGKFTSDHGFDAEAVSNEVGAAAMMKLLEQMNEIQFPGGAIA